MTTTEDRSRAHIHLALTIALLLPMAAFRAPADSAERDAAMFATLCRSSDAVAVQFRDYIVEMVTGTDTAAQGDRKNWNLPVGSASEVAFVSDSTTCARAASAHAAHTDADTMAPPPVHVLRVGRSRFIVWNYTKLGEFLTYLVFDDAFNLLEQMGT